MPHQNNKTPTMVAKVNARNKTLNPKSLLKFRFDRTTHFIFHQIGFIN